MSSIGFEKVKNRLTGTVFVVVPKNNGKKKEKKKLLN